MRTIVLSSIALALVGCSPSASDTNGEAEQTAQSATAPAPPEPPPAPEASAPPTADGGSNAVAQEPFNNVPAGVNVIISRSDVHSGTFGLMGIARVCGEMPKELNFSGVPAFVVQFYPDNGPPARGPGEVTDVTFDSKELVGDTALSSKFFLSLTLQSITIGTPYALVLDTSQPNMSGEAKLSMLGPGNLELAVDGINDRGEVVAMTLTCGPKEN
jgi:hypothetical protein